MSDDWAYLKQIQKEKRLEKAKEAPKWTALFEQYSHVRLTWKSLYHCRLEHGTLRVDVWPTTGRFWVLGAPHSLYGLENFRKLLDTHGIQPRAGDTGEGLAPAEVPLEPPILQPLRSDDQPGQDASMSPF